MDSFGYDDEKALCANLKQLVIGFSSQLHDVESVDEVQNSYLHMEEFDKDFHRYELVRSLRGSIEETLGTLIDSELDRQSIAPNHSLAEQETLVSDITRKVLNSSLYGNLLQRVRSKVERSCEHLLANFEQEFLYANDDVLAIGQQGQADLFLSDAEAESSIGDSLSQSAIIFMNADQQLHIADKLNKLNNVEVRKSALRELLQVTSLDVQNSETWSTICNGVRDALLDNDETLWMLSLRFVARGLSTNSQKVYLALVEFLKMQFTVLAQQLPSYKEGLNTAQPCVRKLLLAFRLMNLYLQLLPEYGQRYQERTFFETLEPTIALFATSQSRTDRFSPMHFLALVDHQANWFGNSMHGQFSRACLLKVLEQHPGVVEDAVQSCIEFVSAYSSLGSFSLRSGRRPHPTVSNSQRHCYSAAEVRCAHFVHCMRVVGRLLQYSQGCKFFPVRVDGDSSFSITRMVVLITRLALNLPSFYQPKLLAIDPHRLAVDILKKLSSAEDVCQKVMCKNEVTDAVLKPVKRYLNASMDTGLQDVETVMLHVAEILLSVTSTRCGHQHLLHGENVDGGMPRQDAMNRTAPVDVIVKFTLKALDGNSLPHNVINSFLRVCRMLYHTCEGLMIVENYHLHHSIAMAWRDAKREADNVTPTPNTPGETEPPQLQWEKLLLDDLLNFAGTPKGVLLLQQTGAFGDCISLMYSRYERKLQVSSCEKFGYGYMMSQVATTAPGILALDRTGFTYALIRALWCTLEVLDDNTPYLPKCWPVSAIDKLAKKPFANIINYLSSFVSVYELLEHDRQRPTDTNYSSRHVPETVSSLLDRLVFIDSGDKMQALFNYEQSHVFGLRLLSVMTSCLDTLLLLQARYSFQDLLLKAQAENVSGESKGIIMDMLSLERNYILVKTYSIGGPSERQLPSRYLENIKKSGPTFKYPLFSSFPVPAEYFSGVKYKQGKDDKTELAKFISGSKKINAFDVWLGRAQDALVNEISKGGVVSCSTLFDLIEKVVELKVDSRHELVFTPLKSSETASNKVPLSVAQQHGVSLLVRYGCQLQLLSSEKDGVDKCTRLVKKFLAHFRRQTIDLPDSDLYSLSRNSSDVGFDWFLGIVFLMTQGNFEKAEKFLCHFSALLTSGFLWAKRLQSSNQLTLELAVTGIPPVHFLTCHYIEHVLQLEVPHVYSAFRMSGYAPAQICQHWLRQCFLNFLDWPEICNYIAVCIAFGADYQVYMCVAILKHLQMRLMQNMQDKNLIVCLKEEPIRDFQVRNSLPFMIQLQKKYRDVILQDLFAVVSEQR